MDYPELFKTPAEFKKWSDTFRKAGLKSLTLEGVILEFAPEALLPESEYKQKQKAKDMVETKENEILEAEKLLFWSSPDVPVNGSAQ